MKRKYKNAAERTAAYRERLKAKQEATAEAADMDAQYKTLNLCGFAETGYNTPAKTCLEEIQVHRSWLRALEQPDVLPGETLRELARRTWNALLRSAGQGPDSLGVTTDGGGKWVANTGDEAHRNLTELLLELRGYEVTSANINAAVARIQAPRGKFVAREGRRPLHYVQAPRRTEPISAAAKNDDGARFLGDDLVKQADGSWRSKTVAEQRRDAEAATADSSQAETRTLDASEQAWKNMTLGLLQDGTHSQKARLRAVCDHEEAQGSSWRRIYEACKQETDASVAFRNAKKIQEELKQRS